MQKKSNQKIIINTLALIIYVSSFVYFFGGFGVERVEACETFIDCDQVGSTSYNTFVQGECVKADENYNICKYNGTYLPDKCMYIYYSKKEDREKNNICKSIDGATVGYCLNDDTCHYDGLDVVFVDTGTDEDTTVTPPSEPGVDGKKGDGNVASDIQPMAYIMVVAILAIGLKVMMSITAEASKAVGGLLNKATGGKISSFDLGKTLGKVGGFAARPVTTRAQLAGGKIREAGWSIAKSKGMMGVMTYFQKPGMKIERAKARAEQAKKSFGKEQAKRTDVKKIMKPTDDEVKEESDKMVKAGYSPAALEKIIRDSKKSERERKGAAMTVNEIAEGRTVATQDVRAAAIRLRDKLRGEGLSNEDGEFKDFNKKPFEDKLAALKSANEAIFVKDQSGKVTGIDRAKLTSTDISSINADEIDLDQLAVLKEIKDAIRKNNTTTQGFIQGSQMIRNPETRGKLTDAVLSGNQTQIDIIIQNSGLGKNLQRQLTDAIKEKMPSVVDQNLYNKLSEVQRRVEGSQLMNAARNSVGRYEDTKQAYASIGGEPQYHQEVKRKMDEISSLMPSLSNTGVVNNDFLGKASDFFTEDRLRIEDANRRSDNAALLKIQQALINKMENTKRVTEIAITSKGEFNKLAGRGKNS